MRKFIIALASMAMVSSSFGALGWFQDYIVANVDGGGDSYYWLGGEADTAGTVGSEFNGTSFGVVTSLGIGADLRYWSDNQDRDGGAIYVSIDGGAATEYIWTQSGPSGNDYQGTLASSTVDVASGAGVGVHTLTVWAKTWGSSQGDQWLTDGGNNFSATFEIVPEPATMALFGIGLAGLFVARRRRA